MADELEYGCVFGECTFQTNDWDELQEHMFAEHRHEGLPPQ